MLTSYERCRVHGATLLDYDSNGQRLARAACYACVYEALPSVRRDMVRKVTA